ncbi:hypothetical protein K435DRAFT_805796 [Dendrothele bispora CBS 962.96]|uniref:G-protein coupled receptors family 1 profile domain-containing protein n=1 Tax=Dendrothele bispora (strain CBS 962.96) TaxID=1314807 RepID=A0A4S8LA89_DENBC|nr:hypothetical protein K435DRAFT_805796 [Dendrothele bispora CBS 962.96]
MGAFMFTEDMVQTSIWIITSIVGACMCFIMLVVIGLVALRPVSRHHLDRVSFRIIVYVLLTNMVFGIVSTNLVYTGPSSGWRCGFTMWIFQLTLQLSSFLTFSIALNLQLVVVHRVNGQQMEKFYVTGSCLISLDGTPYLMFAGTPVEMIMNIYPGGSIDPQDIQIGSQLLWLLFTALGETIASLVVFIYIIKHQLRIRKILSFNNTVQSQNGLSFKIPVQDWRDRYINKYRTILIRIVISCIISVAWVIDASIKKPNNMSGYHFMMASQLLYCGRPIVYALLSASDPSLLSAIKSLICGDSATISNRQNIMSHCDPSSSGLGPNATESTQINVELTTIHHYDGIGKTVPQISSFPTSQSGEIGNIDITSLSIDDNNDHDVLGVENQRSDSSSHIEHDNTNSEEMQDEGDTLRRHF